MRDEARWRELSDECVGLYARDLSEAVTRNMWTRIMDEKARVHGIVAEHHDEGVIRTANDVIHESTTCANSDHNSEFVAPHFNRLELKDALGAP